MQNPYWYEICDEHNLRSGHRVVFLAMLSTCCAKPEKICYLSNKSIGIMVGTRPDKISKIISKLRSVGLVRDTVHIYENMYARELLIDLNGRIVKAEDDVELIAEMRRKDELEDKYVGEASGNDIPSTTTAMGKQL